MGSHLPEDLHPLRTKCIDRLLQNYRGVLHPDAFRDNKGCEQRTANNLPKFIDTFKADNPVTLAPCSKKSSGLQVFLARPAMSLWFSRISTASSSALL